LKIAEKQKHSLFAVLRSNSVGGSWSDPSPFPPFFFIGDPLPCIPFPLKGEGEKKLNRGAPAPLKHLHYNVNSQKSQFAVA